MPVPVLLNWLKGNLIVGRAQYKHSLLVYFQKMSSPRLSLNDPVSS